MAAEEVPAASRLWGAWLDALKAATTPSSAYSAFFDQWRTMAGFWGASPSAGASDFLQAMFGGQQALLRMTELAAEAMRGIATAGIGPSADAAGHFKRYTDQFWDLLAANPALSGFGPLVAGAAQYGRMAEPLAELMQQSFGGAGIMRGPAAAGDPLGDALERSFGLLADFPGINQELPSLMREAAGSWLALQQARQGYQIIMAATWQRAFQEILQELLRRIAVNKPVETPGALLSLTTSVADRVFVETFRSERYIEAQQRLSTALADQRRCEAKVVDLIARSGHFPTRREHDEALREINSLRRDVHALKRAIRALAVAAEPRGAPAVSATEFPRDGSEAESAAGTPFHTATRRNGSVAAVPEPAAISEAAAIAEADLPRQIAVEPVAPLDRSTGAADEGAGTSAAVGPVAEQPQTAKPSSRRGASKAAGSGKGNPNRRKRGE
jgi:hypothetical protein